MDRGVFLSIVVFVFLLPVAAEGSGFVEFAANLLGAAFGCRPPRLSDDTIEESPLVKEAVVSSEMERTSTVSPPITDQSRRLTLRRSPAASLNFEERTSDFEETLKTEMRSLKRQDAAAIRAVAPFAPISVSEISIAVAAVLAHQELDPDKFRWLVDEAVCGYLTGPVFGFDRVNERFLLLMKAIYMLFRASSTVSEMPVVANSCLLSGLSFLRDLETKPFEGPIVF